MGGTEETCKECSKCRLSKPFSKFYTDRSKTSGLRSTCKECDLLADKGRKRVYHKTTGNYVNNHVPSESHRQKCREYYKLNKEKRLSKCKAYYLQNKTHINTQKRNYGRARYFSDKAHRLRVNISSQIRMALKGSSYTNKSRVYKVTGLEFPELIAYLYYTLECNYGELASSISLDKIDIDHIVPLCSDYTEEGIIRLNNYTNLQLLTREDNSKKGKSINQEEIKS